MLPVDTIDCLGARCRIAPPLPGKPGFSAHWSLPMQQFAQHFFSAMLATVPPPRGSPWFWHRRPYWAFLAVIPLVVLRYRVHLRVALLETQHDSTLDRPDAWYARLIHHPKDSMRPLTLLLCFAATAFPATLPAQTYTAQTIHFSQPGPFSQQQLEDTAGVHPGTTFTTEVLTAAAQHPVDTGYFDDVGATLDGKIVSLGFVIELDFLQSRAKLPEYNVFTLLHYDE